MKLKITIDLGNSAFDHLKLSSEVTRLLNHVATSLIGVNRRNLVSFEKTLIDINGNKVGKAKVVDADDEEAEEKPDLWVICYPNHPNYKGLNAYVKLARGGHVRLVSEEDATPFASQEEADAMRASLMTWFSPEGRLEPSTQLQVKD